GGSSKEGLGVAQQNGETRDHCGADWTLFGHLISSLHPASVLQILPAQTHSPGRTGASRKPPRCFLPQDLAALTGAYQGGAGGRTVGALPGTSPSPITFLPLPLRVLRVRSQI